MPITFNCACGKVLRVSDASAGKRAKCPTCGAIANGPAPEPDFEIVEDEPEGRSAPAKPRPPVKPVRDEDDTPRPKKSPPRDTRRDEDRPKRKAKKRRPPRRAQNSDSGKAVLHVLGGLAMVIGGIALAALAASSDSRRAARGVILGICLVVVGIGTAVTGLTGGSGDSDDE